MSVGEIATFAPVEFIHGGEIDRETLYAALKLRFDVFVLEQRSLYPELDGLDLGAWHGIARGPEGALVAGCRITGLETNAASIGRIVVAPAHRGAGLAGRMVRAALDFIDPLGRELPVTLGAQVRLEDYYARFGFRRSSGIYDDGGIDHVEMALDSAAYAATLRR